MSKKRKKKKKNKKLFEYLKTVVSGQLDRLTELSDELIKAGTREEEQVAEGESVDFYRGLYTGRAMAIPPKIMPTSDDLSDILPITMTAVEGADFQVSHDGTRFWLCLDGRCVVRGETTGIISISDERKVVRELSPEELESLTGEAADREQAEHIKQL
jgi:hypothetical protein